MINDASRYSEIDENDKEAFWETARQRILTSLIIAQQGVERWIRKFEQHL